jgi:predicted pyridoxine 5'-phosphate oxidase superfamily flavin-nucleotide-binding protein
MLYHEGNRVFQDQFDSRRLADRLEEKLARAVFSDDDKSFVESCIYFFIATADASGHPDCSFKGGAPGFVRVTGPSELAFPDYDGNGMFKSLGNLAVNPHVGLLFITMHGSPKRLRINGDARIDRDDHWDRNRARPAVGEGFPLLLFRLQDGFTVPPWLTFPEAPL